jgi:hypothetical protein
MWKRGEAEEDEEEEKETAYDYEDENLREQIDRESVSWPF